MSEINGNQPDSLGFPSANSIAKKVAKYVIGPVVDGVDKYLINSILPELKANLPQAKKIAQYVIGPVVDGVDKYLKGSILPELKTNLPQELAQHINTPVLNGIGSLIDNKILKMPDIKGLDKLLSTSEMSNIIPMITNHVNYKTISSMMANISSQNGTLPKQSVNNILKSTLALVEAIENAPKANNSSDISMIFALQKHAISGVESMIAKTPDEIWELFGAAAGYVDLDMLKGMIDDITGDINKGIKPPADNESSNTTAGAQKYAQTSMKLEVAAICLKWLASVFPLTYTFGVGVGASVVAQASAKAFLSTISFGDATFGTLGAIFDINAAYTASHLQ